MLKNVTMKSGADTLEREGSHFGKKKNGKSKEFLNAALETLSDRIGKEVKAKEMDECERSV